MLTWNEKQMLLMKVAKLKTNPNKNALGWEFQTVLLNIHVKGIYTLSVPLADWNSV